MSTRLADKSSERYWYFSQWGTCGTIDVGWHVCQLRTEGGRTGDQGGGLEGPGKTMYESKEEIRDKER